MIHVHTLGTVAIDVGRARYTPASSRRFAMLLRLAAAPGERIPRAQLWDLLFPRQSESHAKHSIRELVYQFRLMGVPLSASTYGIELPSEIVRLDYADVMAGDRPGVEQVKSLQGGFLPGYAPEHSEAFSEWLDGYRARTTFELCKALLKEVSRSKELCDFQKMEHAARACLALDSLNEEATLALAEAMAIAGAKAQAVALLDRYIDEVGETARNLHIPATILRRRIGERLPSTYRSKLASPFVGRSRQLIDLRERYTLAASGQSQCVAFLGEPGIGKSRLATEFCTVAALDGAEVAMTSSQANDVHRPFSAFADLAPRLLNMRGAVGCAPSSLKAIERLTKGSSGEPIPFEEAIRDSEAMCDSIAHALVDVIDAIAAEQPLVLAIEDIHWTDHMSTRVAAALLSHRKQRRVFLLLTSRSREAINAVSRYADAMSVVELEGLDAEAMNRMASDLAEQSETELDEDLRGWLEQTSMGNPLFLESLVSHFLMTQERFAISPTLSRLLERRIGALQPATLTTLQICALLGKHSTLDLIVRATELPRFELLRAVGELEEARLVISEADRVRTAHALIADVSKSSLSPIQARLAHRSVAAALDTHLEEAVGTSVVWDCAEHWVAANSVERAIDALQRCAARALETGRPGDAAEAYSRTLSLELSRHDRNEIAYAMALAADAAADPALSLRALRCMNEHPDASRRHELEFLRFRALVWSMLAEGTDVGRILDCVADTNATADHRVTAAALLLKFADANGDSELITRVAHTLPEDVLAHARVSLRLEFVLLRSTILGEKKAAGVAARELFVAAANTPTPERLASQSNAALAFDRVGLQNEAVEATAAIYNDAEAAGMVRVCARIAAVACQLHLNRHDDELAAFWFRRTLNALDRPADTADPVSVIGSALLSACALGRTGDAREIFQRADRAGVFEGSNHRARQRWLALILLRNLEGSFQLTEEELAQLVEGDCGATPYTRNTRDVEMAIACQCLARTGRADQAKTLFTDYIDRRGNQGALPRYLHDVEVNLASKTA